MLVLPGSLLVGIYTQKRYAFPESIPRPRFNGALEASVQRRFVLLAAPSTDQPVEITLEEAFSGTTRLLELVYGRRLEVKIPPGVDSGSRVRVAAGEGQRGTIYLVITVKPNHKFQRKGRD